MDIDNLEPIKKKAPLKNLDIMSIEALEGYIEELETEISRTRDAISAKNKARDEANSAFKL